MTILEMSKLLGKTITLYDRRTGVRYETRIADVRPNFGKTQIQVALSSIWFEPTDSEFSSVA